MLSIKQLELSNFITYKNQIFDFDKFFAKDNILLIYGKNFDDSSFANDNGAGKSIIYDAIFFVLFSKTTKNSNKDLLIGKHSKSMYVCISLVDSANNTFWIKRYRKHRVYKNNVRFKINGKTKGKGTPKEMTNLILKTLGISYNRVLNTSVFESNDERSRFVYLGDKEAKALLSQMKGTDIFLKCYEIANEKVKNLETELTISEMNLEKQQWQLDNIRKDSITFGVLSKQFEVNQRTRIYEIQKQIANENELFKKTKSNKLILLDTKNQKIRKLKQTFTDEEKIKKIHLKLDSIQSEVLRLKENIAIANSNIRKKTIILNSISSNSIKGKIGTICEHCGSEILESNIKKHKQKINEEISIDNLKLIDLNKQLKILDNQDYELSKTLNEILADDQTSKSQITILKNEIRNEMDSLDEQTRIFLANTKMLEQKIKQELDAKNEYLVKVKRLRTNIIKLTEKMAINSSTITHAKEKLKYARLWVSGYGKEEIQAYALHSTVNELNRQMDRISDTLTDGMVDIKLLTEKTQGNKKIRNIFELEISDLAKKGLSFKEWSKGQRKRIEIISSFALMNLEENLISEVFLDELFDGVDKVGISKIANLLTKEAISGKKFIVFSHSDDVKNLFHNKGVVELKNGISRFLM